MAASKRKIGLGSWPQQASPSKKTKKESTSINRVELEREAATDSDPMIESDTNTESGEDDGVSWPEDDEPEDSDGEQAEKQGMDASKSRRTDEAAGHPNLVGSSAQQPSGPMSSNSRESHTKQKALARERKATKPNADSVARSKKLWEQLRRKSHVPLEERRVLIDELFSIITGHVRDFVFKHDSVRVIQTALKYANKDQRRMITKELEGDYRALAEGRYSKFLLGKMLVYGDTEIRDRIVPSFYGSVRKLINHPEAAWVLDDIYRGAATAKQKAILLREWYGAEFAILRNGSSEEEVSADLKRILDANPEKKAPIFKSLHGLINQLVQKKKTGFTMLHDAMLQYFHNLTPGSSDMSDFMELLKSDDEGDLLKNLAFTHSGSELVSLALAYGSAKDRKQILKVYKSTIQSLAYDKYGRKVLVTAYEVIDDTQLTSKSIFPELVGKTQAEQETNLQLMVHNPDARIPLLYLYCTNGKGLSLPPDEQKLLSKIRSIRESTSKKAPQTRRQELVAHLSPSLLPFIETHAHNLIRLQSGCQFMTDVLLNAPGGMASTALRTIARLPVNLPPSTDPSSDLLSSPSADRMFKALVLGGRYNPQTQKIERRADDAEEKHQEAVNFHDMLYAELTEAQLLIQWATGSHSFVIVAMLEADGFGGKEELMGYLRERKGQLANAAAADEKGSDGVSDGDEGVGGNQKGKGKGKGKGNRGAKLLLEKLVT